MKKLLLTLGLALGIVGLAGCGTSHYTTHVVHRYRTPVVVHHYHAPVVVHHYHAPVVVHHHTTIVHHTSSTVTTRPRVSLVKH